MIKQRKAIIIGGGHNGLICAAYLARGGFAVTVLEARSTLGGGLAMAPTHMPLHPTIHKELKLSKPAAQPLKTIALSPDGDHLHIAGGDVTGPEAKAYAAFHSEYMAYAKALGPLMLNAPPRLKDFGRQDAATLGKLGWAIRFGLGEEAMREFLRVAGMNIFDVLDEHFSSPLLQGALAFDAVMGCHVGPRTPNTVLPFLMRMFHAKSGARISSAGTGKMLEDMARGAGVTLRCDAKVDHILMKDERAVGVALAGGEEMEADVIASNADAKTTFLTLVGARHLDGMFTHRISKTRTKGDVAHIELALSGAPNITGLTEADLANRLLIVSDMRTLERAFNAAKYGEYSQKPVLEMTYANGKLAINAAYAPYDLKEGWDKGRAGFEAAVLSVLEDYAPGIGTLVTSTTMRTPVDIEADFGNAGGHWHHGEMSIDHAFMMRPVHGTAQYETPIPGLYLCGAAAHPGGDITGLPGRNAAKRIVKTA